MVLLSHSIDEASQQVVHLMDCYAIGNYHLWLAAVVEILVAVANLIPLVRGRSSSVVIHLERVQESLVRGHQVMFKQHNFYLYFYYK